MSVSECATGRESAGSANGSGREGGSGGSAYSHSLAPAQPTGLLTLIYSMSLITYAHIPTEALSHVLTLALTHSLSLLLCKS